MTLNFRQTFISDAFPENLAGLLVQRIDLPGVLWIVLHRGNIAVKTVTGFVFGAAGDRCADENCVSPYDRARMGQTRDLNFPTRVNGLLSIPGDCGGLALDDT